MANASNSTIPTCKDSPLSIAAGVLAIITFALALAASAKFYALSLRDVPDDIYRLQVEARSTEEEMKMIYHKHRFKELTADEPDRASAVMRAMSEVEKKSGELDRLMEETSTHRRFGLRFILKQSKLAKLIRDKDKALEELRRIEDRYVLYML